MHLDYLKGLKKKNKENGDEAKGDTLKLTSRLSKMSTTSGQPSLMMPEDDSQAVTEIGPRKHTGDKFHAVFHYHKGEVENTNDQEPFELFH
jgi:hypothetical protein